MCVKQAVILLIFAFVSLLFFDYVGIFHNMQLSRKKTVDYVLIYRHETGNYKKSFNASNSICAELSQEYNLPMLTNFGIYWGKSRNSKTNKLHSITGCLVEKSLHKNFTPPRPYKIANLPPLDSLSFHYPYKNRFCTFWGTMKTNNILENLMKKYPLRRGPILEIYDSKNGIIKYFMPLSYSQMLMELYRGK